MASQVPGLATSFADLAVALLSSSEVAPRARLIAQQACELVAGGGVVVYVLDRTAAPKWVPKATAGEVAFQEPEIPFTSGTLGMAASSKNPAVFAGAQLPREEYAHLNVRRTLVSLAVVPLTVDADLVGAMEVLSFDQPINEATLRSCIEIGKLGALGLTTGLAYEKERNTNLESITRLAQLYDLEKVFNSTLEMDELLKLIASKFQEILRVQTVNVWMVEDEGVTLMSRAGQDDTVEMGAAQTGGQGLAGDIADKGEAVLIDSPNDPRLEKRNAGGRQGGIFSYMAAPLMSEGAEVGLVEVINKQDGTAFDEDDLFFLTTINETASGALKNASLLQAERKVEILEALVTVSQEMSSTLNLDRVMQAIVTGTNAVIPYERAAIVLEQQGKLKLSAVSGMTEVNAHDPQIQGLNELLQWASGVNEAIHVRQTGEEIDAPREETRAKFRKYFADTGVRAFYCLPLADDTGRVGLLSFESSDPDFLTPAHLEMIKVLASQATVALRNAQMYKEVPFITVLEPVLQRKRRFLAMGKRRRRGMVGLAVAAVLVLTFLPLPMRVGGEATVAPAHRAQIQPEVAGVVRKVYVREGDAVKKGTILADLEDWDYRAALAAAQAKHAIAVSEMNRALAASDGTTAGIQRVQADYWVAEVQRAQQRLDKTHLRSPIDGVVATPHVENFAGKHLEAGDNFAEVVDASRANIDVAVDETETPLLQPGDSTAVKLDGFPTRTFRGSVTVVSPRGEAEGDRRVFFARVDVPNPEGLIRTGMQGRAKVSVGWHAAGYVLFRGPGRWFYDKLWSLLGW